jgi:hypothetical protein
MKEKTHQITIGITTSVYREIPLTVTSSELKDIREEFLPESIRETEYFKEQIVSDDNITDTFIDYFNVQEI